ncbi:hypothetical protein [Persicirhabdus sediminis]|uniref:Uncharacterized protein n=1 Tax=Persicirhabdus sediminis TaxID=454144 RepID=A0A8J7MCA9_9BACT|nr:hypothetical protein [Persicirhabdus sediminis]MBK1789817.1 hypothetical protein [Persicirhabdus sediminis]
MIELPKKYAWMLIILLFALSLSAWIIFYKVADKLEVKRIDTDLPTEEQVDVADRPNN